MRTILRAVSPHRIMGLWNECSPPAFPLYRKTMRSMNPFLRTGCGTAALLLAAACSDGGTTPPDPTGPPGLHVVSGGGAADSIQAVLAPLVVELRDAKGRPVSRVGVEFTARVVPGTSIPAVYVRTSDAYSGNAVAATDATGRATLHLAMGAYAGPAWVVFGVRSLGLLDSVRYEIRPGAPVRLAVTPRDTLVAVGTSFTVPVSAFDRQGNPTAASGVALVARTAAVTTTGMTVRAQSFGRTAVVAQLGVMLDSVMITVMPRATLAVEEGGGLTLVASDGTSARRLLQNGSWPSWMPDGTSVLFSSGTLMRVAAAGDAATPVIAGSTGPSDFHPNPSHDGQWIYFNRLLTGGGSRLWRVRPDGTGVEIVPGFDGVNGAQPSPSGTRLAYETGSSVAIGQVGTGQLAVVVNGRSPEWSPTGEWIAYLSGSGQGAGLRVVRPDGSGIRTVGLGGSYGDRIDWSPDGEWLVARSESRSRVELIHVPTNLVIAVPNSATLHRPAWGPP